jgi:DNA-binding transcriptional LysR family regulator
MQIKSLENTFGVKLLNVKMKRVGLTKAGKELFPYAEELCHVAIKSQNLLQNYHMDNIKIGLAMPLSQTITSVVDTFKKTYPTQRITLREGTDEEIISWASNFAIDIGFTGTIKRTLNSLKIVQVMPLQRLVLAISPNHQLADKKNVTWDDLAECPLIVHRKGMTGRDIILEAFKERSIEPTIVAEVDNIEVMKKLIKIGIGAALKFYPNVEQDIATNSLKIVQLKYKQFMIGIDAIFSTETPLSVPAQSFLELTIDQLNKDISNTAKERSCVTFSSLPSPDL